MGIEQFVINEGNEILDNVYIKDNYKEVIINPEKSICFIFFSSNGIYYPDTYEVFEKEIIEKDKFEWVNQANDKTVQANAGKMIFLRDVYKSWYVTGINSIVNSVDALINFLRERTMGYKVITVGNSAGGYAAALFGVKLKAEIVLNWGGQFSLYKFDNSVERNRQLSKYKEDKLKERYYDIKSLVAESETEIFYFYAAKCQLDVEQFQHVAECPNVYGFGFKSKRHGNTMFPRNNPYILSLSKEELHCLYERNHGRIIDKNLFYINCLGVLSYIKTIISMSIKKINKYIKVKDK